MIQKFYILSFSSISGNNGKTQLGCWLTLKRHDEKSIMYTQTWEWRWIPSPPPPPPPCSNACYISPFWSTSSCISLNRTRWNWRSLVQIMLPYHHFQCPTSQTTQLALEDTKPMHMDGDINGSANTIATATSMHHGCLIHFSNY